MKNQKAYKYIRKKSCIHKCKPMTCLHNEEGQKSFIEQKTKYQIHTPFKIESLSILKSHRELTGMRLRGIKMTNLTL